MEIFGIIPNSLFNKDDIIDAYNKQGTCAMLEEVAKTSLMFNAFRYTFKNAKKVMDTSIKAASIYTPSATKNLLYLKTPITMLTTLGAGMCIKPTLDNLWQTEYEKSLQQNKN